MNAWTTWCSGSLVWTRNRPPVATRRPARAASALRIPQRGSRGAAAADRSPRRRQRRLPPIACAAAIVPTRTTRCIVRDAPARHVPRVRTTGAAKPTFSSSRAMRSCPQPRSLRRPPHDSHAVRRSPFMRHGPSAVHASESQRAALRVRRTRRRPVRASIRRAHDLEQPRCHRALARTCGLRTHRPPFRRRIHRTSTAASSSGGAG